MFLPRLPTDRILRRGARAPDAPFAATLKIKGAERLAGVNAAAEARGLVPGMAAADARAMCPALTLAEADPHAEQALLEAIADWHRRFTPLAAVDPPDGVMLDVTGAAHLFGGEAALLDEIARRLAAQGFEARAALAPGPALARALARFSTLRHVAPEATPEHIEKIAARLPIAALGLPAPAQAAMQRAGLRTIGDLLARPRAPLAARFGAAALARLDALACRIRDPIVPRFEAPEFLAERRFPHGLTRAEDIEATLRGLARELCALLGRHGVGARRLAAAFYRVDGAVKHLEAGTSRPLRDPATMTALLRERLAALEEEGLDTGYGFDVMQLSAQEVQRDGPAAGDGLFAQEEGDLADLIDRLGARLGLRRVLRLHAQEAHLPEFAVAAMPAAYGEAPAPSAAPPPALSRPLRLLEHPEPIDAIALMPDGPPLRFRWRRALYETAAFEGPERIAPPWWKGAGLTRDYFHIEDQEGRRFWLFREGLYAETLQPRWWVHGLF